MELNEWLIVLVSGLTERGVADVAGSREKFSTDQTQWWIHEMLNPGEKFYLVSLVPVYSGNDWAYMI